MKLVSPGDLAACEATALRPGSTFEISFRFAPAGFAARILALEALFVSVRNITYEVSDPAVGLAKLSWWQKETRGDAMRQSQHPVVRALRDSEALAGAGDGLLAGYFNSLAGFLVSGLFETGADLLRAAKCIGGQEAILEAGGTGGDPWADDAAKLGAAGFLAWLIRNIRGRTCSESWWVPLDFQARFGVTRDSGQAGSGNGGLESLVSGLGGLAMEQLESGRKGLGDSLPPALHHLMIRAEVERRFLQGLIRAPRVFLSRPLPGPRAVLAAWSRARSLRRRQSAEPDGCGRRHES